MFPQIRSYQNGIDYDRGLSSFGSDSFILNLNKLLLNGH